MGDFIEPETHRSTLIKVKIETLLKKIRNVLNPKILYNYAFSNCSVK